MKVAVSNDGLRKLVFGVGSCPREEVGVARIRYAGKVCRRSASVRLYGLVARSFWRVFDRVWFWAMVLLRYHGRWSALCRVVVRPGWAVGESSPPFWHGKRYVFLLWGELADGTARTRLDDIGRIVQGCDA